MNVQVPNRLFAWASATAGTPNNVVAIGAAPPADGVRSGDSRMRLDRTYSGATSSKPAQLSAATAQPVPPTSVRPPQMLPRPVAPGWIPFGTPPSRAAPPPSSTASSSSVAAGHLLRHTTAPANVAQSSTDRGGGGSTDTWPRPPALHPIPVVPTPRQYAAVPPEIHAMFSAAASPTGSLHSLLQPMMPTSGAPQQNGGLSGFYTKMVFWFPTYRRLSAI